jgi:hydrogenase maturation factor
LNGVDVLNEASAGDAAVPESLVAVEHPGSLAPSPAAVCTDEVCTTCSDEGRVAEVTAVHADGRAEVLAGGRQETVDASLVDAGPGDFVLVHAGVAISLLVVPAATGAGTEAAVQRRLGEQSGL